MKAKDVEKAILADGWYRVKSKGHLQYKHPTKKGRVTIPWHDNGNKDLNPKTLAEDTGRRHWPKTLASIEDQAGIKLQ